MTTYDDMMGKIERSISDYNAAAEKGEKKIDWAKVRTAIRGMGGRDADSLAAMAADDLAGCGVPVFLARKVVASFSAPAATKPAGAQLPDDLTDADTDALVSALEERGDGAAPSRPTKVCRELTTRASGRPYLLLKRDGTLDRKATTDRVEALQRGKGNIAARPMVDGRPVKPLLPGESPRPDTMMENPLYPGRALIEPGLICDVTQERWDGLDSNAALRETAQFLRVALDVGALVIRDEFAARSVIDDAKRPGALDTFMRRYPRAVDVWERMPPGKRPDFVLTEEEASPVGRHPLAGSGGDAVRGGSGLLTEDDIYAIHTAAISLGLAGSRGVLLGGLPPAFVATLPGVVNPGGQTLADLHGCNVTLDDGSVPLTSWLRTAFSLHRTRPEASVFRRMLDRLTAPAAATSNGDIHVPRLSGMEHKAFREALMSAFPSRDGLAQMVRLVLGVSLDTIVAPGNLTNTTFELVNYTEAQGWTTKLLVGAIAENGGNPQLRAIANQYRASGTPRGAYQR